MILLTGASGFVGRNLLSELLRKGRHVRCLLRDPAEFCRDYGNIPSRIEVFEGDVTARESAFKALCGGKVDMVIHLVGILLQRGDQTFRTVHVEGSRNMVEACRENGIKRYIQMSALGTRANARSEYHRTKWEAEEIVRESGLDYTIFRPSVIFGREDKFTNLFARAMRLSPFIVVPGNGRNRMQPVFIKDLVKGMVKAATETGHEKKIYEVGGPEILTFDEILNRIAKVISKKRLKIHVPLSLMKPVAGIMEAVLRVPPLTRDQLLMLEEDNVTDDNALTGIFALDLTTFEEGIRGYLH